MQLTLPELWENKRRRHIPGLVRSCVNLRGDVDLGCGEGDLTLVVGARAGYPYDHSVVVFEKSQ